MRRMGAPYFLPARSSVRARAVALALGVSLVASPVFAELGFLGPRGTFSEQAAEAYRLAAPEVGVTVPFETMTAVVEALRGERISRGILPVASTVAGFPAESSRLLLEELDPGFRVVAELVLPIDLHLMVRPGTSREDVRTILSHPNALGEARAFLDVRFPGNPREETASTAAAAKRVKDGDGSLAAVASLAAARLYDLEILDSAIQEDPHNATSFWAIVRPEDVPSLAAARRLVLVVDAPAGSSILSDTVASLDGLGFNLVFLNSRPLPGELYGFRYLLSLEADSPVSDETLSAALSSSQILRLGAFD